MNNTPRIARRVLGFGIILLLSAGQPPGPAAAQEPGRSANVLVLLGEWFGDAYFPLAKEIEARGWTMKRVGLDGEYRGCYNKKRDVVLRSDIVIQDKMDLAGFDALIIPSGPQWRKFNDNPTVLAFVRNAHAAGLIVASFCVGNTTVKAAGLVDLPAGPELYPDKVTLVKERVLLGPRGGGPPPGDGFESAPIKEICDAVARELAGKKAAVPVAGRIHEAVRAGDLAKVKALVAGDPAVVNEKDARGRTPLHFAGVADKPDILAFLIAGGADAGAADAEGFTPLHWAAAEGRADAARALIAAGADPNALSARGVSTLESAFYGRHPEAVEALLQGGLKVETAGDAGAALLHRAAQAGFTALVEHLLKNGADAASTNVYGGTLLHSAASGGLTSIIEKLAAAGANINAADDVGQTPLHLAAAAGRKDLVDKLISKGADLKAVCRDGRTLMHCAAMGGLVDLMDRLADAGLPVDAADRYGRTPLLKAAEAGSDRAAEFLLSRGADVMKRDSFQQTPLHEAAFTGNLRLLEVLVKHGADVDALNKEGSTPLLYVTQAGREEVVEWLLAHGAKLNVRNEYNETPLTFPLGNGFVGLAEKLWPRAEALKDRDLLEKYPLHRAAYLGVTGAVSFALNKGVPIDLKDESGRTPFQRAAQGGNVEIARMLLSKGAVVDAPAPDGSTPLHLAVKKGRKDMVRLLLEKGAAVAAKDGRGRTPLELAAEYGYPDIADVLVQAGAAPKAGDAPKDVRSILARPLKYGQAIVWSLGHCGFAVKTRSRLLIFDYFSRSGQRPAKPSLANGFVDPEEIKDQDVTVFVSHSHGDHFDPVILGWRPVVKNIRYVFGWNARKGERTMDMAAPRPTASLDGLEIFTVNGEHNDVPETAYLVKADGLSIFHAGDYISPTAAFKADMEYLRAKAGRIDLAFISQFEQAAALAPAAVFPMHGNYREYMYEAFAREAAEKKLPSRVLCPENKGDRYEFLGPAAEPRRTDKTDKAAPSGPYLGQKPPGMTPEVFAPGIVSKEGDQGRLFIAPDGSEIIYWERDAGGRMRILSILNKGRVWSEPEVLPFSEEYINNEPCLSPDGKRLYFVSNRPRSGTGEAEKFPDVWVVEKTAGKWGQPKNLGEPVNRLDIVVQPFMAADGKLYFGGQQADRSARGIYVSQPVRGVYSEPEMLDAGVFGEASGPCVSPDSRVLIVHARKDGGYGSWDLYASFRDAAGNWGALVNLGSAINTEAAEAGASFSPDGKYLFFSRAGDIFWVSAKIPESLRPKRKD